MGKIYACVCKGKIHLHSKIFVLFSILRHFDRFEIVIRERVVLKQRLITRMFTLIRNILMITSHIY